MEALSHANPMTEGKGWNDNTRPYMRVGRAGATWRGSGSMGRETDEYRGQIASILFQDEAMDRYSLQLRRLVPFSTRRAKLEGAVQVQVVDSSLINGL